MADLNKSWEYEIKQFDYGDISNAFKELLSYYNVVIEKQEFYIETNVDNFNEEKLVFLNDLNQILKLDDNIVKIRFRISTKNHNILIIFRLLFKSYYLSINAESHNIINHINGLLKKSLKLEDYKENKEIKKPSSVKTYKEFIEPSKLDASSTFNKDKKDKKTNKNNKNKMSTNNKLSLVAIIIGLCSLFFYIGLEIGKNKNDTEKATLLNTNKELNDSIKKLYINIIIKDSLINVSLNDIKVLTKFVKDK